MLKEYKLYDFKKSNFLNKSDIENLKLIHEKINKIISKQISSIFKEIIDVKILEISQLSFQEYENVIEENSFISVQNNKNYLNDCIIEYSPFLANKIISKLMGSNNINNEVNTLSKEFTDIEKEVFLIFNKPFTEEFNNYWMELNPLFEFKLSSNYSNKKYLNYFNTNNNLLVFTFEVNISEVKTFLSISYFIEDIKKIFDIINNSLNKVKESSKKELSVLIKRSLIDLNISFAETEMSVKELINLKVGETILFNKDEEDLNTIVYIGNNPKYNSFIIPSKKNKNRTIKILK